MESDVKPTLIRAVESNNEIEVKRLLDGGVDVNETDDQGKTALFYAAQNDNESIAVLLIGADADVDAKDIEDKTALFYAAANKSIEDACGILVALVEKGESLVNETDIYGRTPLFYAITNSIPFTRYLLDHDANLHAEDNCNVSILTCLVEYCLMKQQSSATNPTETFLFEVLSLLLEKGLERQSIVKSILNLVFCKAPLLFCSNQNETAIPVLLKIRTGDILKALTVAVEYADESCSAKKELILKVDEKIRSGEIFAALDLLSKMQTSSNSTDSAGNTALHYTTVLPLMGVPQESVMKMCTFLRTKGVHFSKPNHQSQTPLLFCLSANNWKMTSPSNHGSRITTLVNVCTLLLKNGSKVSETLQSKETVFHLMMKLFQLVFNIHDKVVRKNVLHELMKLLEVFAGKGEKQGKVGNKHDESDNSPLHLWATLILPSPQDYTSNICENYTFENALKLILDSLLKCGANVNYRNNENETPLHLCKTWTAVKLLLDAGANPNEGRSPLLVSAKNGFYSDVGELKDPKLFWKNAVKVGLDPWRVDNNNESVLNFLRDSKDFVLAQALADVNCEENLKDGSEQERGECVENALEKSVTEAENKTPKEMSTFDIRDSSDQPSLGDAETPIEDQFSKPEERCAKRSVWRSVSEKHKEKLKQVSIQQECERIQTILYHKDHIAKGGFGFVFIGIDENDGREVAIKRIQNYRFDEEEMKNLIRLADCEQVVRYLYYIPEDEFSFMILELMEGTLDEYLEGDIDKGKSVQLCKDVVMGLRYLHHQSKVIIHRDLKPANILYKTHPNLCLKIADFGLSLLIDSGSNKGQKKHQNVGTRCWRAPEVFSASNCHSGLASGDVFSCGLLLHYILSRGKHPFSPADCADKSRLHVIKTEENITQNRLEGWDDSLSPEATHLVKGMLESNEGDRPSAGKALEHPLFWAKDKKIDLLVAVGNQPEFACLSTPTAFQKELDETASTVIKHGSWKDPRYSHMSDIYDEMREEGDIYNTGSVVELIRFIRCAYMRFSEKTRSVSIKTWLHQDFVFLEYFPDLVLEVYKAVTTHGWDQTREVISKLMFDHEDHFSQKVSLTSLVLPSTVIPWTSFSKVHHNKLVKVAKKEEYEEVDQYWYHKDPIATGQFGQIFAGINKMDGREVAIKRIDKMRIQKPEDSREIRNLTLLADCKQVVFYLLFFQTKKFAYVILELMEGNLDELLNGEFDKSKSILLCKDVVTGMKYLHGLGILHRDLKPSNILYKAYPKLCLKLADFGLSRRIDSTSSISVCGSNAGTKCWMSPEVLKSPLNHSKSSDNFTCGLISFYILSMKRHPFSPVSCDNEITSSHETEANIAKGEMKGMDNSLSPEAIHLLKNMLDNDVGKRPTAEEALEHPLFWSNKKKIDLLKDVGNQPEFEFPRSRRTLPLTSLETDLEKSFSTIVKYTSWNDPSYLHMPAIYAEMEKNRSYTTNSIVELVCFIRNAYENVSAETHPKSIEPMLFKDFVFLEYFPHLVIEVYKAVSTHGWDQRKEEIPQMMFDHGKLGSEKVRSTNYFVASKERVSSVSSLKEIDNIPILIPWTSVSIKYKGILAKVARRLECGMVYTVSYHKDHIGSGSFGLIFAGINEKDGREVAIKRIEKLRMQRSEDRREITNLTALADCEQVVRYLSFFEDKYFSYIVLELMEGNLDECLNGFTADITQATLLCKDILMGLKFLHAQSILHRDLKPSNILYKTHPKLSLKIADFGLSRRIDMLNVSTTVYGTSAGTRCWIAPEVLVGTYRGHSMASDMFSCGLLLHYILSGQKHPFSPTDCTKKSGLQVVMVTETNVIKGNMEGWEDSLSPEATHLVKRMLESNKGNRQSAGKALNHPLFWSKARKIDLLVAVGNQPEFECPRSRRAPPLTQVETDLERSFGTIVRYVTWNDLGYVHMPAIYAEMMTRRRIPYDTHSIVELLRFIRNAYAHISMGTRSTLIRKLLLEDFVFLEFFPGLVMEVYKAVITRGWDQTREEIKYAMMK